MKEINYKEMKFNPFNLIGDEWMLITAGDEHSCKTMTASWGHLGCLWGNNDPSAVVYIRESRYIFISDFSLWQTLIRRIGNTITVTPFCFSRWQKFQ